jgi:hypothetical protein
MLRGTLIVLLMLTGCDRDDVAGGGAPPQAAASIPPAVHTSDPPKTAPAAATTVTEAPRPAVDLLNEDWVIPAHEWKSYSVSLGRETPLRVEVTGISNVAKGFTVRVVPSEDADACLGRAQGACRSRGGFDGFGVRSMNHTETLPAGRWTFLVRNSENILNRATVHVHLVSNPG